MLSTPAARRTRAITLLELVVVVTVIAAMAVMGTGLFPGPIQYFRARRSMDGLMWDLRKVQQRARSRGNTVNAAFGGIFGVAFYAGSVNPNGTVAVEGFSYLPYGPTTTAPSTSLTGLTAEQRGAVVNLDPSLVFTRVGAATSLPARIQFDRDVSAGRADVVPDPSNPMAAPPGNVVEFRLHDGSGVFRVQFEGQRFIGLRYVGA